MIDRKRCSPIIENHDDAEEARIQRAIADDPDTWAFSGKTHDRPTPPQRIGRPRGSNKTRVTTLLDNDVIAALKSPDEKGWQTRLDKMLRDALKL